MEAALSPAGLVYGVVLNDRESLERLGEALTKPPYQAPPQAPVLYVKPWNTHLGQGAVVTLPAGEDEVEIGATLGLVFGADVARVSAECALEFLRGYVVVADLSLPHQSYYRPAVREKCFDGACPMGAMVERAALPAPQSALIRVFVNDELVEERTLEDMVRSIPQLIADVTEFMTLKAGDVLLCGVRYQAPRARVGSRVAVAIEGLGRLDFRIEEAGQ